MSADVLTPPVVTATGPPKRKKKRRRRRFSLNGLAIQLSAFALSFTLVALLVVSGSQQAFVEENEAVTTYVPIGTPTPSADRGRPRAVTPQSTPSAAPTTPPVEPTPTPEPEVPVIPEVPSTVIRLADTDAGTAMFGTETVLAPGVTSDRCIEVDYSGNVDPQPVRLYAAAAAGALAPYLDLTVDMGSAAAGAFGDCGTFVASARLYSGTLDAFAAAHGSFATGLETWAPGRDGGVQTFRFTVSVQDDPVAEGKAVAFGFSWETRDAA